MTASLCAPLTEISLETVLPQHIFWLAKIAQEDYTGMEAKDIILDAARGQLKLWDWKSGSGLVVTELLHHPAGSELLVFGLAGEGLGKELRTIAEFLKQYAREQGCRWVGGNTTNMKLQKLSFRLAKAVSTRFIVEV